MKIKKQFGLIGQDLTHSFSRKYHNDRFLREGIDADYVNFELKSIEQIKELVARMPSLVGLNVTVPYKQSVIRELDNLSEEARQIGAVNTILIAGGKLMGYNTDVFGFQKSLMQWIHRDKVDRALVLGTGGASRAVTYALKEAGIPYTAVSRNRRDDIIAYQDIGSETMQSHQLIINTTPLGMEPDIGGAPELPYEKISHQHWVYDLVYNPQKTILLSRSEQEGASIKNGLQMLHLQADKSWHIWKSHIEHENGGVLD